MPEEDEGYFLMGTLLPDAASSERTDSVTRKIEAILKQIPEIQSYTVINGYSILSSTNSNNSGTVFVQLTPWHDRKRTSRGSDQGSESEMCRWELRKERL